MNTTNKINWSAIRTKCPSCGSSRSLSTGSNSSGNFGYCFKEAKLVDLPDSFKVPKPPSPEEKLRWHKEAFKEAQSLGVMHIKSRKLHKSVLERYGCKVGVSEADGKTPLYLYVPYRAKGKIVAYKVNILEPKSFYWIYKDGKRPEDLEPFGLHEAKKSGSKSLVLIEGEKDLISLEYLLSQVKPTQGSDYTRPASISLIDGSGSVSSSIGTHLKTLKSYFKYYCSAFDMDEAGEEAVKDLLKYLPDTKRAALPANDINECLMKGLKTECFKAIRINPSTPKTSRIIPIQYLWDKAKRVPEFGVSWPWENITQQTRGIRKGETIYIGAAPKMGKSEIVNAVAAHLVLKHNWNILLVKPEESATKTVKMINAKVVGKKFHDPKFKYTEEEFDRGRPLLEDKVFIHSVDQELEWSELQDDITVACEVNNVSSVFIDPITNLTNGKSHAETDIELKAIAPRISKLALTLNFACFLFCHLNPARTGKPHDRGGSVLPDQFTGSRAMVRSCNYAIGLEGNIDPELLDSQANKRKLVLLSDREFGETGMTYLSWDPDTSLFSEISKDEYSSGLPKTEEVTWKSDSTDFD